MTDASIRAVARRLQTACNAIEKLYQNEWTSASSEGKESLLALRHLAKRLNSSSDGYWDGLPVFDADVEPGLEDDRLNDMNDLLNSVSSRVQVLADVLKKVRKHLLDSEELYDRLCTPEPVSPATSCNWGIETLFRRLYKINDLLSENYENRRIRLNSVSWDDLTSIEQLIDAWECRTESRHISLFVKETTAVTGVIRQSQE